MTQTPETPNERIDRQESAMKYGRFGNICVISTVVEAQASYA